LRTAFRLSSLRPGTVTFIWHRVSWRDATSWRTSVSGNWVSSSSKKYEGDTVDGYTYDVSGSTLLE
jgi:hypothetical protein